MMKKLILSLATIALIVTGIFTFAGCEKEEETMYKTAYLPINSSTYYSYTGEPFNLDDNFQNEYDYLGIFHNQLMEVLAEKWNEFTNSEASIRDMLLYATEQTERITEFHLSDYGIEHENFVDDIIEQMQTLNPNTSEIEDIHQYFGEHPDGTDGFLDDFFFDYENLTDYSSLEEILQNISIMEQKVFYSSINETVKNDYLRFCAVLKYSYINTYNIIENPHSGFYPYVQRALMQKGKKEWTIASFVASDAVEAVHGVKYGAAAGVAAGPVGSVVGGVIGAVTVGGMASAVKYACTETIKQKVFHVKD